MEFGNIRSERELKVEMQLGREKISIETGKVAKQADGSAWVKYGGTVVLVTAVAARKEEKAAKKAARKVEKAARKAEEAARKVEEAKAEAEARKAEEAKKDAANNQNEYENENMIFKNPVYVETVEE